MKRLFITMIAAFLAVMLAAPVYAADNLELGGSYFARAWSVDDSGHAKDVDEDYFHQRFRMQGTINVADDVSAVIRADFAEAIWGDEFTSGSVARPGIQAEFDEDGNDYDTMHVDRTYININKEMWNLTVGQQYAGLGILEAYDANITGVNFGLNLGPANLSLIYAKVDEGMDDEAYKINATSAAEATVAASTDADATNDPTPAQLNAANAIIQNKDFTNASTLADIDNDLADFDEGALEDDDFAEDTDHYAVNLSMPFGNFDSNLYYAMVNDDSELEAEPWVLGFMATGSVGMVNLTGEIDTFGGDMADGTDYEGTQIYLSADSDVTDMVNIGGEIIWAAGTDDDDETQITGLTDWASWTATTSNTPLSTWATATLSWSAFDPFDESAGSVGASIFADFTPMEKLSCGTKIMYLESEEDGYADGDMTSYNAYVAYELATNTTVSLTYLYSDIDLDLDDVDQDLEEESTVMAEISLAF